MVVEGGWLGVRKGVIRAKGEVREGGVIGVIGNDGGEEHCHW